MSRTVLHLSAHPDDELLGAPAALMAMRDAGYRVLNVACGLGSAQRRSRVLELKEASRRTGFEARVADPPALGRAGGGEVAPGRLAELLGTLLAEVEPEIVVSPSPHDRHPSHELLGRSVRDALEARGRATSRWWLWGLWGPLSLPTLGVAFDHDRLQEIIAALGAYDGELERNDYRRLVRGRAEMNAALAPELIDGFGARGIDAYAELLTEVVLRDRRWMLGAARWLDAAAPDAPPSDTDAGAWLASAPLSA